MNQPVGEADGDEDRLTLEFNLAGKRAGDSLTDRTHPRVIVNPDSGLERLLWVWSPPRRVPSAR